jgi:hypothetical protein
MMIRGIQLIASGAAALAIAACSSSATPAQVGSVSSVTSSQNDVAPDILNLVADGSFEKPVVPAGSYTLFSTGSSFSKWTVVGASGNVAVVSGTFTIAGITFPAECGMQWLDLTGVSNTATGVAQTISTVPGSNHTLSFWVGNVDDPNGTFGETSTVNVLVNGQQAFTATNSRGDGLNKLVWQRFTTTINAPTSTTTIAFLSGDPSNDNNNGLDCVKLN